MARKCKNGKSCGNSCIAKWKRCLKDFSDDISSSLDKLREKIFMTEEEIFNRAVSKLSEIPKKSGTKAAGGNLLSPAEGKLYLEYYEKGLDLERRVKRVDVSDELVDRVWNEMYKKEKDLQKELGITEKEARSLRNFRLKKVIKGLKTKGSPAKEILLESWTKPGTEDTVDAIKRGKAVLKSLLEADFKSEVGQEYNWMSSFQLDHAIAGTLGGGDNIDNWLWLQSAVNQEKGAIENQAKNKKFNSPEEEQDWVRSELIEKIRIQANRTQEQYEEELKKKADQDDKKLKQEKKAREFRDSNPSSEEAAKEFNSSSGKKLKSYMKAYVAETNLESDTKGAYRPIFKIKPSGRTGSEYPKLGSMRALLKLRTGSDDEAILKKEIKSLVDDVLADSKSRGITSEQSLRRLLGNFPPKNGISNELFQEIVNNVDSML